MKKATLDECFAFVRNFPRARAGDIPTKILRTLNLKREPNDYHLAHPRLAPIHEFIRFVLSNYERRFGIKIRIVSQKEMFDLIRRKECRWLLCYFLEYCYLPQERTVFIEQDEYDGRCATFLDYVQAILKSRRFYRIPIRNIRLFDLHAYPSRSVAVWNTMFTMQYPLLRYGRDFYMYYPHDLFRCRMDFAALQD